MLTPNGRMNFCQMLVIVSLYRMTCSCVPMEFVSDLKEAFPDSRFVASQEEIDVSTFIQQGLSVECGWNIAGEHPSSTSFSITLGMQFLSELKKLNFIIRNIRFLQQCLTLYPQTSIQ